jgi:hypothetical protein
MVLLGHFFFLGWFSQEFDRIIQSKKYYPAENDDLENQFILMIFE